MSFLCFWKTVPSQVIIIGSENNKSKAICLIKVAPIDIESSKSSNVPIVVPQSNKLQQSISSTSSNKSHAIRSALSVSRINPNLKLKPLSVLLVDDSLTILKLTKYAIENVGHIVETANNGLDAKNKMLDKNYDVVLIDFQMPIMGGIEATRLFREFEENAMNAGEREKKQLIVGMSAAQDFEMWQEAMRIGIDDFLSKPFKFNTFMNVVASLRPEFIKTDKDYANTLEILDGNAGFLKSDDIGDSLHKDKSVRFLYR